MAREDDEDGIEALLATLGRRPDDAMAAASAQSRSRRRWLRQQADESSTMAGVLLTLAERATPITLRCGPWSHEGRLNSVTTALAIMELPDGIALLPMDAVTSVEAGIAVTDDRGPAAGPDLAAVLADVVGERPPVRLLLADGDEVGGTLIGVGKDVAVVRSPSSVATIRLSVLAGCILPTPGDQRRPGDPQSPESGDDLGSVDDFGSG